MSRGEEISVQRVERLNAVQPATLHGVDAAAADYIDRVRRRLLAEEAAAAVAAKPPARR